MAEKFGFFVENMKCKVVRDGKVSAIQHFKSGTGYSAKVCIGFKNGDKWSNLFCRVNVTGNTQTNLMLEPEMQCIVWGSAKYEESEGADGRVWQNWTIWADRIEPMEGAGQPQREQFGNNGLDDVPF